MDNERNKLISRAVLERGFNEGDLSVIDEYTDPNGVDHQEPAGTPFIPHLKEVITGLRTAFPDLHFEIHDILADGEIVAFRSTMTGTHQGIFSVGPMRGRGLPPTGRKISVPHMHFVRIVNGKTTDLWHVWNIPMMMTQLGIMPEPQRNSA
jgi:predicted ester cyclase